MQPRRFGQLSESGGEECDGGVERLMKEQQLSHIHPILLGCRIQFESATEPLLRAMRVTELVVGVTRNGIPLRGVLRIGLQDGENGASIRVPSLNQGFPREDKYL